MREYVCVRVWGSARVHFTLNRGELRARIAAEKTSTRANNNILFYIIFCYTNYVCVQSANMINLLSNDN